MKLTEQEYLRIHELTFGTPGYAGYKPTVQESPNGDGVWDTNKKYAHIAPKYNPCPELMRFYERAFQEAIDVCVMLGLPRRLDPCWTECCMRILDYPPGASSAPHTDFDYFTIQLYRDRPEGFVRLDLVLADDEKASPGIHWGEMAEVAGLRQAMPHLVMPLAVPQRSIVFFVLPSPSAELAPGLTAGEWLAERYARSRR
jgi:hypothetical protein